MPITDKSPQNYGLTVTYARRFSFSSFLGMGSEEDDGSQPQKLPKRSEVNKHLAACTTPEEWLKLYNGFVNKYGEASLEVKSGNRTKKSETWDNLFTSHEKRVNGVNPIDANKEPEDPQAEWDANYDKAGTISDVDTLEKAIGFNKALDTDENWKKIEELQKKFNLS
jgi:hypothetical protein